MAVGDAYKLEYKTLKDPYTGVEFLKLTDSRGNTIHPYFTQPLFSSNGETILLTSDRTGEWQLYKLDIPDRIITQLTDDRQVHPHQMISG